MVVKIVEPLKAGLVELFGQGSTSSGALDLRLEEVEGGEHEDAGEDEEDQRRPGQPFPGQVLHDEIEGEVHGNVGQEDEEEDGGELCVKDEQESHAEQSVDGHEDDQKPKPGKSVSKLQSTEAYNITFPMSPIKQLETVNDDTWFLT